MVPGQKAWATKNPDKTHFIWSRDPQGCWTWYKDKGLTGSFLAELDVAKDSGYKVGASALRGLQKAIFREGEGNLSALTLTQGKHISREALKYTWSVSEDSQIMQVPKKSG